VLAVLFVALFRAATGPSIAQAPPSPTPFVVRLVVTDAACVPHVLVVPADIEVTVELVNESAIQQIVAVPDLEVYVRLDSQSSKTISLRASPGSYTFACSVGSATPGAAEGELSVTSPDVFEEPPATPLVIPSGHATPAPATDNESN